MGICGRWFVCRWIFVRYVSFLGCEKGVICCGVLWGEGGGGLPALPGQAPHAAASSRSFGVPVEGIQVGEDSFWGLYAGYLMLGFLLTF